MLDWLTHWNSLFMLLILPMVLSLLRMVKWLSKMFISIWYLIRNLFYLNLYFRISAVIIIAIQTVGQSTGETSDYFKAKSAAIKILKLINYQSSIDPQDESGIILVKKGCLHIKEVLLLFMFLGKCSRKYWISKCILSISYTFKFSYSKKFLIDMCKRWYYSSCWTIW